MLYEFGEVYSYAKMYMVGAILAGIVFTVILSVYTYCGNFARERKRSLLVLHSAIIALQTSQFLTLISPPREFLLFTKTYYICLCLLGVIFLQYCHTLAKKKIMSGKELAIWSIVPACTILLVIFNQYHQLIYSISSLFYSKDQPLSAILISGYNLICAAAGLVILLKYQQRRGLFSLARYLPYPLAILIVFAVEIMELLNPHLFLYDLTPVSISMAQIILVSALVPLSGYKSILTSRINVLDRINEGIIMTDTGGNILYANDSPFNKFLGAVQGVNLGSLFAQKLIPLQFSGGLPEELEAAGELTLDSPGQECYAYYIQPIKTGGQYMAGILYIFRDVSQYKSLINNLNSKNSELALKLEFLRRSTGVVKQLAEERERSRIMGQINSTVGQSIKEIISQLESIEEDADGSTEIKERILKAIEYARKGIGRLRESVSTLNRTV